MGKKNNRYELGYMANQQGVPCEPAFPSKIERFALFVWSTYWDGNKEDAREFYRTTISRDLLLRIIRNNITARYIGDEGETMRQLMLFSDFVLFVVKEDFE